MEAFSKEVDVSGDRTSDRKDLRKLARKALECARKQAADADTNLVADAFDADGSGEVVMEEFEVLPTVYPDGCKARQGLSQMLHKPYLRRRNAIMPIYRQPEPTSKAAGGGTNPRFASADNSIIGGARLPHEVLKLSSGRCRTEFLKELQQKLDAQFAESHHETQAVWTQLLSLVERRSNCVAEHRSLEGVVHGLIETAERSLAEESVKSDAKLHQPAPVSAINSHDEATYSDLSHFSMDDGDSTLEKRATPLLDHITGSVLVDNVSPGSVLSGRLEALRSGISAWPASCFKHLESARMRQQMEEALRK